MKKRKTVLSFTLAVLLLFLGGCTKFGKNITIEGRVENPVTGEGIEGVEIVLQKTTMGLPGGPKSIKEVYTDGNGNFELNKFSIRASQVIANTSTVGDYYSVGWNKEGEYVSINSALEIKKGKKMHVDFHAVPYGSIKLHVKNTSCFNSQDNVKIYFDGEAVSSNTYSNGLMTTLSGCVDITDPPLKCTIGKKYFHWVSTKNNVTTTYHDTVFVDENTVSTINVFY